jgi:hypothetical protein
MVAAANNLCAGVFSGDQCLNINGMTRRRRRRRSCMVCFQANTQAERGNNPQKNNRKKRKKKRRKAQDFSNLKVLLPNKLH